MAKEVSPEVEFAAEMAAKLLLNQKFVVIPLNLANLIGLEQAALLKGIDDWCNSNRDNEKEGFCKNGHYWTYGSYEEWAKRYPFLGNARSLQRLFLSLEQSGLLISDYLCERKADRRKWYRVNQRELGMLYIAEAHTKRTVEAKNNGQNPEPATVTPQKEADEYKYIVPKMDGHRAKNGSCSYINNQIKELNQTSLSPTSLTQLPKEEREQFESFVDKEWRKAKGVGVIDFDLFLAQESKFKNWWRQFLASPEGQKAKQEASSAKYDWENFPLADQWAVDSFPAPQVWIHAVEAEREMRRAFWLHAKEKGLYEPLIAKLEAELEAS